MEFVQFVRDIENVPWHKEFSRVYFGEEFCDRKLPTAAKVSTAYRAAREHGKSFTLVLPFITQTKLKSLKSLLLTIMESKMSMEIIFNDWGAFDLIRQHNGFKPVLGRLLNKQRRDPRLLASVTKYNNASASFFRQSNVDSIHYQGFLARLGVERIEFDNLLIGLERKSPIAGSIYYPYGYITTTRYCQSAQCEKEQKYYNWIKPCHRECDEYLFELHHPSMQEKILLKGNSLFYRNDSLPTNLSDLNINRIVNLDM